MTSDVPRIPRDAPVAQSLRETYNRMTIPRTAEMSSITIEAPVPDSTDTVMLSVTAGDVIERRWTTNKPKPSTDADSAEPVETIRQYVIVGTAYGDESLIAWDLHDEEYTFVEVRDLPASLREADTWRVYTDPFHTQTDREETTYYALVSAAAAGPNEPIGIQPHLYNDDANDVSTDRLAIYTDYSETVTQKEQQERVWGTNCTIAILDVEPTNADVTCDGV